MKKRVRAAFKRCKQLVKLLTLGITVYSAFTTANHVTPLSLFFLAFLITAFVLQILFDVILSIFVGRIHFLWDAVEADIQELKKPVTSVGNFFKKLTGKEVETPTPNKNQLYLEEKVIQEKERKRAEKRAKKGWRWFARKDPAPTQDDTTDTED